MARYRKHIEFVISTIHTNGIDFDARSLMEPDRESLAERLLASKQKILNEWEQRVRHALTHANAASPPQLRNEIPKFIDALAEHLATNGGRTCAELSIRHGIDRAGLPEYEFSEVHQEYEILREVMLETLETTGTVSIPERNALLGCIFAAVRTATDEYSKQKLEQERKLANDLRIERDLREQFVATLTHDLRTPLSVVRAGTRILQSRGEDGRIRNMTIARMDKAIDDAERMIRDLLDAGQIRTGAPLKLNIQQVALPMLIQDVITDFTLLHGDRFEVQCPVEILGYWCPASLKRVLENMLDNAVKYGWHHTRISISARKRGDEVVLEVNNRGRTIPPDELPRLFEPYYRASTAEAAHRAGWGLGLLLVRGLVEAHGGKVQARSSETEGTTFTVVLPVDARPYPRSPLDRAQTRSAESSGQ